jgi:hypothetical protein
VYLAQRKVDVQIATKLAAHPRRRGLHLENAAIERRLTVAPILIEVERAGQDLGARLTSTCSPRCLEESPERVVGVVYEVSGEP